MKSYTRKYILTPKIAVVEEQKNKEDIRHKKNSKMSGVNPTLSVITLNVNRLSTLIKMQKLAEWVKKNMIQLYTGYNRNTLDSKSQIS